MNLFKPKKKWDYENGFYLSSDITRIPKLLAHYELYKRITSLPGQVVECGVYKGASLIRFATFREVLESPFSREIVGFDAFGEFPKPRNESDLEFVKRFEKEGGDGYDRQILTEVFEYKKFRNIELVEGDVLITVPDYLAANPELKIALLHVDVDVYEPTLSVLENFFERVVPGGVVILDDYGAVDGATRAIDEFVEERNLKIEKFPFAHVPAFIQL